MSPTLAVRSYGDRAVLVETDESFVLPVARALLALDGVSEVVPAARTVLARIDPARLTQVTITRALRRASADDAVDQWDDPVLIEVTYDGPDLGLVAADAGCSPAEVIQRHSAPTYTVAFCGFSPGFAYLTGLHPSLVQPRLATPRARVPAGAVAIAAGYTAAYPQSSPGGWRLLGRTDAALWDTARVSPSLLRPGDRVRFVSA
ncbi:MAG: carboxyltransferase domain-containing protein [Actinobacteria bacterium]|nr:carboxyltransferase domain-containing protein [Actinomycetota bacterium]